MTDKKITWLENRLNELGKTKKGLADYIGVRPDRINMFENGLWRFQVYHVKKLAQYLEFDQSAFLDFISGDITLEQLKRSKTNIVSDSDMALLNAIKTLATNTQNEEKDKNTQKQKENER